MLSLSIFLSFLLRDGSEQIAVTFSFTVIVQCSLLMRWLIHCILYALAAYRFTVLRMRLLIRSIVHALAAQIHCIAHALAATDSLYCACAGCYKFTLLCMR